MENQSLPFPVFAEYILPLQIDQEPIENWRKDCMDKFSFCMGKDVVYSCDTINNLLKKDFSFSTQNSDYKFMPWKQLDTLKKGDCFHMAKSVLYPLRALGIPTTIDFTPCWGNTTGGHSWNVAYVKGKMIPFMGREMGLYKYDPFKIYHFEDTIKDLLANPYRYPAKIYRRTFSVNKLLETLVKKTAKENLPPFLQDCRIQDVTSEYFPAKDVNVLLNDKVHKQEIIYLAVYSYDWTITAYPEWQDDRQAIFKNLKTEILYMPVVYRKGIILPIDDPFILDKSGKKKIIQTASSKANSCHLQYLLPMRQELSFAVGNKDQLPPNIFDQIYSGRGRKKPTVGETYSLYCWNDIRWKFVQSAKASEKGLLFQDIPAGALFFLADKDYQFIGRCFTVENENPVWW